MFTIIFFDISIAIIKITAANQGAISLRLLGGKLAPKLVYFVLNKVP